MYGREYEQSDSEMGEVVKLSSLTVKTTGFSALDPNRF